MYSELPIENIKANEMLLRIYNRTKTLFLDPGQTLNSFFNFCLFAYLFNSVFSKENKIISK